MIAWTTAAPAIGAAFVASTVEVVEAFTIVLAVATVRGWRPALAGTAVGVGVLALIVAALSPLLPLTVLQLVIGVLLLLFGLGWLRKAVLRAAGLMALHDEAAIYQREEAALQAETAKAGQSADWLAGMAAFQAVLLEGLEVIFIVIAVGAGGHGLIGWAALGALAACVAVLLVGVLVHKPLAKVPENTLKFGVGV